MFNSLRFVLSAKREELKDITTFVKFAGMKRKLRMEMFKIANVNLENNKIFGAKKGTKKYYHELGHLKFESSCKIGNRIRVIQDFSQKFLLFLVAFEVLLPNEYFETLIIVLILLSIYSEIYEEKWAWNFAKRMGERDDRKTKICKTTKEIK